MFLKEIVVIATCRILNEEDIEFVKKVNPFYEEFKSLFNAFYLSHEIGFRKPNTNIYEYVLQENNLKAHECLFIDDTKENTEAAIKSETKSTIRCIPLDSSSQAGSCIYSERESQKRVMIARAY